MISENFNGISSRSQCVAPSKEMSQFLGGFNASKRTPVLLYSAATQTKICLTSQLKHDVKSATTKPHGWANEKGCKKHGSEIQK
jgi:hypothetical protein